jgi:predicted alpha/beta superfamily hydrolase
MLRALLLQFLGTAAIALLAISGASAQVPAATQASCKHTITGEVEVFDFSSKVFANTRPLRVFLPPGYNEVANKDRKYPVLYMFDGQNLFDACTAYDHVHEWEIDETVTRLVKESRIEPVIVVGIDNAQEKRAYEYLPWKDTIQQPFMEEPNGKMLPTFMIQELMPAMAKKYRIETEKPGNTAIGGSSYGGVAALYVALSAPMIFTKVIAESPVLIVGNGQLVRDTVGLPVAPEKVFMGLGGSEAHYDNGIMLKSVQQMERNLKAAQYKPAKVEFVLDEPSQHNEQAWAKRFPQAIEFLFPAVNGEVKSPVVLEKK